MKLQRLVNYLFLLAIASCTLSCKEDVEFREPSVDDGSVPEVVSNINVENLAGKARITYKLPNDKKLLYVKAIYKLANGSDFEAKSSYYKDTLVVEGFADTEE